MDKYDLHTHGYSTWNQGKYSLEKTPRHPKYFLNAMKKSGLRGIVLANWGGYGDWGTAYEEFCETSKNRETLGDYHLIKELDNALIFTDSDEELYVIKGEEIASDINHGNHIMGIGLKKWQIIQNELGLKKTIEKLTSAGAIINADHYNRYLGIGENNLRKFADQIDTFEGNNQNYSHWILNPILGVNPSIEKANAISEELGINWISVSDCHNFRDFGAGYIKTEEELNISSSDNLKESLTEILIRGRFTPSTETKMPLTSPIEHALTVMYDFKIRNPLGWTNLGVY